MKTSRQQKTLRIIAAYEAVKGVLALLAMVGLLSLLHHDLHHLAVTIIGRFGFDASTHYPSIFVHWADAVQDSNKMQLFLFAMAYVAIRFSEAYGLWLDRKWAEWLAALSGAVYLPFEAVHLYSHPGWSSFVVLASNAWMVGYLIAQLRQRQRTVLTLGGEFQ
jgi:uncharacterized membrane protein (DUF2068 family)